MKKLLIPVFTVLAAAGIATSIHKISFDAPLQFGLNADGKLNGSSLFFNQKIFYLHTAHAMLLIVAVVVAGVSSIVFLLSRGPASEASPIPRAWWRVPGRRAVAFVRTHGSTWDDIASASVDVAVA